MSTILNKEKNISFSNKLSNPTQPFGADFIEPIPARRMSLRNVETDGGQDGYS